MTNHGDGRVGGGGGGKVQGVEEWDGKKRDEGEQRKTKVAEDSGQTYMETMLTGFLPIGYTYI